MADQQRPAARIRLRWLRAYRFEDGPMPWYQQWFAKVEWRVRKALFVASARRKR